MPFRILHIASWYPHRRDPLEGGFIADRISGLAPYAENHIVHMQLKRTSGRIIFSRTTGDRYSGLILEAPFLRWRWLEAWSPSMLLRDLTSLDLHSFDLVVVHVAYPLLVYFRKIRPRIPVPVILSEHWSAYRMQFNLPTGHAALERMKGMLNGVDGLIVVSQVLRRDMTSFFGVLPATFVVPNAVREDLFRYRGSGRRHGALAVNRWTDIKQPMILLEAWRIFLYGHPGEMLTIAGDGPRLKEMRQWVVSRGLSSSVRFTGALQPSEVARLMQDAHLLVVSSRHETFSLSAAEALMCGTPVVSTPLEVAREWCSEEDCMVASGPTASDLARAMSVAFVREWDRSAMSARAAERFASSHCHAGYWEVLRTFIQN